MSKITICTLAFTFACAAAAAHYTWRGRLPGQIAVVTAGSLAPYTVVLDEKVTRTDGTVVQGARQIHALRSDGSIAMRMEALDASRPLSVRRILLAQGARITTDDIRELKSTVRLNPERLAGSLRDPATRCTMSLLGRPMGPDEIAGSIHALEHGIKAISIAVDNLTMRFAINLSCAPLGHVVTYSPQSHGRLEPTEIRGGEPDQALFDVPSHYKEVPPTVLERQDPESPVGRRRDALYYATRF